MKKYFLFMLAVVALCGCQKERYVTVEGFAQGGTYHVIYKLPEKCSEKQVLDIIEGKLFAIDNSLSGYNKGSLLTCLNEGEDLPLDSLFIECFNRSREVWEKSEGAFDPSAAPLFDMWGFGFEDQGSASQQAIDSIMQFVGMDKVRLATRENGTFLEKDDPRIKLNFNAIAQGFTCDVIAAELERLGCFDYLVEVGREIICKGKSSRGAKWRIGLDKPLDGNFSEGENLQTILELTDCGIVTSGNYRKFYIKDGHKYAHTIDPRIGRPVEHHLLCATIIIKNSSDDTGTIPTAGSLADAYATWAMVIGLEDAKTSIASLPGTTAYLVYETDGEISSWDNL